MGERYRMLGSEREADPAREAAKDRTREVREVVGGRPRRPWPRQASDLFK
jgi:hypothetical protein